MPGIVGLITTKPREQAVAELFRMVASVHHGSNLITGTWIDEDLGVYVGWTARKGSSCDSMPLRNESGDVILTISGEEFAEPETLRRLTERGHAFDKEGLSYLVHLYEEDASFPAALNGRFHGLLADRRRQTALLFNDRYGMHRIYCHESAEAFYFAAEAKAILAVRPELRQVDPRGMGELVTCGCVLENRTLFSGIHVLPPAAAWAFRNGAIERKGAYFEPREWEEQTPLEPETYYQQLRDVFSRRLPRYFNGRERVGMSLTGGLDTRMIMAWQQFPEGSLPCYSFGSMFRDCQDVVLARQVARACGQTHQVIPVEEEFLARFPSYAERAVYLTDGCVNVAHAPDLYVGERAAEIAPVRMTGNYGGEVLRRVRAFKPIKPAPSLFAGEFLPQVDLAEATYHELRHVHPLSFAVFRQAPWHHYGLLSLEQTQVSLRSPFLDNDFVRTVFRAPQLAYANNDVSIRLIGDGNPALARIQTDRGLLTARNGLQARALQKFIHLTVKAEYAYDYGMPHWVSRVDNLLSPLRLERLFLGRHKFYHFRVWYRRALAGYVREMLLDPRTLSRPYLQREAVESMVRGHLSGSRNYTSEIHKLLTLELVHRSFVDSH